MNTMTKNMKLLEKRKRRNNKSRKNKINKTPKKKIQIWI